MRKQVVLLICLLFPAVRTAFGQTDLIVNGGFEAGSAPWAIQGQGAGIVTGLGAFAGSSYLTLGNASGVSHYAYQTVTFPTNLIAASLSFYVDILTSDVNTSEDAVLTVYITDTNQNVLATVGSASNLTPTDGYDLVTFPLTTYSVQTNLSSYAGQSVDVYFTTTTVDVIGLETTFNIDNVSLPSGTTADIPVNDNFTNRTALTANTTVAANTFCASKEPGEPNHAGNSGGHSVWWTWTPATNGIATLTTTGSTFVTLLAVYTGSALTNLTKVMAENGNNANGGAANVKFPFSAGTAYQIAVDGNNGAWGTVMLNLSYSLDSTPPKVAISSPAAGANLTNSTVVVKGTASDNVAVTEVQYSLANTNGTNAYQAATGTTNWSATVAGLIPGPNTVTVQAIDTSGNLSATASRIFNYIVTTPLTLATNGDGAVSGAANGQLLAIGESYTITAKAATGFKFVNWTGSQTTTNSALSFIMASNLTFTANFVDDSAPTLAITAPKAGLNVSNANYTVTGTAEDNVGVASVSYQLNGGAWLTAGSSNSNANWSAGVQLTPGTNAVKAFATDAAGNNSTTQNVSFIYIQSAALSVATNGDGTVSPNDNGALLAIGKNYTLTAKAGTGFKFVNWTGSQTTTNAALTFTMASNLMFTANFADDAAPTLTIVSPKSGLNVSNAAFTASGTAKDNVAVGSVLYQLNGGSWTPANGNGSNWTANLTLTPGTNKFSAYAVDTTGNLSVTDTVSFVYVLSATLSVATNGDGTVSPNYNGALLEIGKNYSMTAKAGAGFKFVNWTGSQTTTNSALSFLMASNLSFTANFMDDAAPILAITAPKANQSISNTIESPMYLVSGTAKDNVAVTNVLYQFNDGSWTPAKSFNSFSNWMAAVSLNSGSNKFSAYAVDTSGNLSITSSVSFVFVVLPDWAPDSVTGMTDEVTPDPEVDTPYTVTFGDGTFSRAGIGTNSANFGVGFYSYIKTGTNTAQILRTNTAPPTVSNEVTSADLVFTNLNSGTFSNTVNGSVGVVKFIEAKDLTPASASGKTLTATKSGGNVTIKLNTEDTYVSASASGTNSGTYTYTSFSPTGSMLQFDATNTASAGEVNFVQLTFTSTTGGDYYLTSYDNLGDTPQIATNTFTLK